MSLISSTEAAAVALERLARALRDLPSVPAPALPGAAGPVTLSGGGGSDRQRADWRLRLQDPQEIEALKRRLGLA